MGGGWRMADGNSIRGFEMKKISYIGTSCMLVMFAMMCSGQHITPEVDLQRNPNGMPDELVWSKTINVGPNLTLPATIEVTAKGNGFLSVGEVSLGKVYDAHDDGTTFEGFLADIAFKDINDDGFKDVVISGIINTHHEKQDEILSREAFVRVYLYDIKQQTYLNVFDTSDVIEH